MKMIEMAQYSTGAQRLLYQIVMDKPQICTFEVSSLSQHRSIQSLLAHMIGAEQRWVAHLEDMPRPARYEDNTPQDMGLIFHDWRSQREITLSLIKDEQSDEMQRIYTVLLPHWNNFETKMSKQEILFHIFNHENYHRAQCSMLLQIQGIDPLNFDYPFLKSEEML